MLKNRIKILDDITVNKIAAGEVVDRPASIVKELIENSIDAGADRINIEIKFGGKSLIKIYDNGIGIPSTEVQKCFLRHATSKIENADDLFKLCTLGFRGEALASISAVSKVEMTTRYKDDTIGTYISIEGGKIISKEPIGANTGTIIVIRDLFFNTPARKKFLKSDHSETINVSDVVNKLAIGYPNIKFKYVNNGKNMITTPGDGNRENAIRSIYGREIASNLIPIEYKCNLFGVDGYIGNNNIFRSNRNLQHVYINGRSVKSKIILDAITEAYKAIIPINKHAICFINMNIDSDKLDVNIHPAKREVKFEKEREIYFEIQEYIRAKLLKSSLIAKYSSKEDIKPKFIDEKSDTIKSASDNKTFPEQSNFVSKKFENISMEKNIVPIDLKEDVIDFDNNDISNKLAYYEQSIKNEKDTEQISIYNKGINEEIEEYKNPLNLNECIVCGTIFDTYIILQKGESMVMIDQHAAHERILFEKYMSSFKNKNISVQMLLDPILIELSNIDISVLEKNINVFSSFGFEVEIFGKNHILVRGVPNIFGSPQSEKFILEIIDNMNNISNVYDLKYDRFAIMACKSAIKANYRIKNIEISELFNQLEKCENPYTCPHGRPIMIEITKFDIEKMFKRII